MPDKDKTAKQLIMEWASQGVFDALGDAISIQDTDFKVLYQNESHKDMVGEHIGEYCYKGYQRKDSVCENCHLAVSFEDGKVHEKEQVRDTDDGIFYYEITSSPLKDSTGKIIAGTEIVRDITKRKRLGEILKKRERELAESQKVALIGSWDWDIVNNRLTWSDELFNLFGVSPRKFQPSYEAFLSMVDPDDKELLDSEVKKSLRDKSPYHIDVRIINKDGRKWIMEARGVITCDDAGNAIKLAGTAQDITERKKMEENLKESEERFRLAMLGASDGLWDWDLLTDKVYYSPRWKSMLGYADNELDSHLRTWMKVVHPDDLEPSMMFISDFLAGRSEKYEMEFRLRHKDGNYLNILSRATLVRGADGKALRLVGTHVDITERKKAEDELKRYREFLENLVKERTAELEKQKSALENKNVALREVIGQIELEKNKIKENISSNIDELVIPILRKAKTKGIGEKHIGLIEQNLKKITSSFGITLSSKKLKLTPREIDVCNMIEKGMTNKEMSDFLNISIQSVEGYRKNIRKKLGLSNKKVNLSTYLRSLS